MTKVRVVNQKCCMCPEHMQMIAAIYPYFIFIIAAFIVLSINIQPKLCSQNTTEGKVLEQKNYCSLSWEPLRELTGGVLFLFPQVQLRRSTLVTNHKHQLMTIANDHPDGPASCK